MICTRVSLLLLVVTSVSGHACIASREPTARSWVSDPKWSEIMRRLEHGSVTEPAWAGVSVAQRDRAIKHLRTSDIVVLSDGEFHILCPPSCVSKLGDSKFRYLVRGVEWLSGRFILQIAQNDLWVFHSGVGEYSTRMRKAPLIVGTSTPIVKVHIIVKDGG